MVHFSFQCMSGGEKVTGLYLVVIELPESIATSAFCFYQ